MVKLHTNFGIITLELDQEKAPVTVENFLHYVNSGFYDNTIFHRVIDDFMIQGGGLESDMKQKNTQAPIQNEATNGLKNDAYTIAMARTADVHSATSQFFINVVNNDFSNYKAPSQSEYGYTAFGKVISGIDVVQKIASIPTGSSGPFPSDVPKTSVIIEDIIKLSEVEK